MTFPTDHETNLKLRIEKLESHILELETEVYITRQILDTVAKAERVIGDRKGDLI